MSDFYEVPKSWAGCLIAHLVGNKIEDLNQLFVGEPRIIDPIDCLVTSADDISTIMRFVAPIGMVCGAGQDS